MPGVQKAATAGNHLGEGFSTTRISKKGSDKQHQINFTSVSYDYLDVMGIEVKEGRGFSSKFPADTMNNGIPAGPLQQVIGSVVINEMAVNEFGLESPVVGKQFQWATDGDTAYYVNIVGVMKDFHFTSLRNEIKPFGFVIYQNWQNNFVVKLAPQDIPATLSKMETLWSRFSSERTFEYVFLDETFARLYVSEARFQKVFISLVVLGIIIACLGLFALATFAAERRIKEIGIRKVLGASVPNLVALLSKDFLILVVIALFIAVPLSWWAMNKWLDDFAYRVNISGWVFVVAAIIALMIAFLTISSQAIKAALANPVNNLRTE
jgi:putative ABC transport system permease protein